MVIQKKNGMVESNIRSKDNGIVRYGYINPNQAPVQNWGIK